jgi:uncharacterized membrane-anchored protein
VQQEAQTVTIVRMAPDEKPARELSMIDVSVAAFGLTGVIMVAALVAGLIAGATYIWYRSRRAVSIIEARGHQHNLFRG